MGSFAYQFTQHSGPPVVEAHGSGWLDTGTIIRLMTTGDRVGIGTMSPAGKLEVLGNDGTQIMAGRPGDTTRVRLWAGTDSGVLEASNASQGGGLAFVVNGSAKAEIGSDGRLGIGTLSPRDRLEVSGGNIRVSGGSFIDDGTALRAPDYVFEEDYYLMSLEELQNYIDREGHLPNVPNAEEIANNGLNLSQFQMKLLEKVEELTLYTLRQQERLSAQQQQINELMAKIEATSN
jgi:hypothetical protein